MTASIYPQLRLDEFRWDHGQPTIVRFNRGLTILHGKTQADRTIILRLIRYALGGNDERIDKNVMHASEGVELVFSANGETIRSIRGCDHPTGKFDIVDSGGKRNLSPREVTEVILDKLGMPKVYMSQSRLGETREILLTFNDLSRAVFVDRDISYSAILSEVPPPTRKEIVKVMLGLTTREIAEAENRRRQLETEVVRTRQRIEAIYSFLTNLDVPTIAEIDEREQNLRGLLTDLDKEDEELRAQVRNASAAVTLPSDREGPYAQLRLEFLSKRAEYEADEQELLDLDHQTLQKTELRSVLDAEARRLERHLVAQHVVSTYTFTQCPRCLQAISEEMRDRELAGSCMLCGRPLQTHLQGLEPWEKALRDVRQMVNETTTLLTNYGQRQAELRHANLIRFERLKRLESELDRETDQYVSPLVEQLSLRTGERMAIERGLSQLEYEERQRRMAIQLEQEELPRAELQLEGANNELQALIQQLGTVTNKYNAFLRHFRHFLDHVKLDHPIEGVTWDEYEQLPELNRQSYKKAVSGPDLALTVLAFHYALAAASVDESGISTNYPKLLVIDEPEQQKMGKMRYQQVMKLFGDLVQQHPNVLQIVVATEASDIPAELEHYAFEI